MGSIWNSIREFSLGTMERGLELLHGVLEPIAGVHAWGWAIIALTLIIRIFLLPLAIKQIRSMRSMQALQPKIKEIQKKHKVSRDLMKKDPDQYRAKKQKLNEEMMALYQKEGVNPAASCLPLLAQAPVFIALFWVLRESEDIANQPFYFFTSFISSDSPETGLGALTSASGWPGLLLIVLMIVTMFVMQKQMMARQASSGADNPMAQQQKIMLYALPPFLGVISWNLPLGVLLYWVTTNAWQGGQQAIMLREVRHEAEEGTLEDHLGGSGGGSTTRGGKDKGKDKGKDEGPVKGKDTGQGAGGTKGKAGGSSPSKGDPSKGGPSKGGTAKGGKPKGGQTSQGKGASGSSSGAGKSQRPSGGGSNGKAPGGAGKSGKSGKGGGGTGGKRSGPNAGQANGRSRSGRSDHLPRRPSRG